MEAWRLTTMYNRRLPIVALVFMAVLLSGCPKGNQDAKQGLKEEELQDYDAALAHFQAALHADPSNTEYKLKADRLRFEASNYHMGLGDKLREKGDLSGALVEFQKAAAIDPSNSLAAQELRLTLDLIGARNAASASPGLPTPSEPALVQAPPKLSPPHPMIPPVKMTNDSKVIFETIGKLAGLTVIFDPDFASQPRRITVELPSVTYDQALDIVSLQSKAYWKPITSNIIFVSGGDAAKRKEFEEEVVRIFYLSNITSDKDLTEIVTAIRNLFTPTLPKINVITAQNAIVIRDTPDKVMLVGRLIDRLDKAKPEVVVEVSIAEVNRDIMRNLGVTPGTSASLTFSPPTTTTTTSTTATTAAAVASLALNELKHLSTADYQVTLPSASVNALLNDSNTKILQNPEIRSVDGQHATLRIGDRVPVATGSFQAGIGAGVGTAGSSVVSPLVNTQFQYQDVGVNVDLTPHILPNRDVGMHVKVEVSSVTGSVNIGGINQPTISQRVIEHDVRLKDGEVNVLAGLIERSDTNSLNGYPGLARIPILRYMFSGESVEHKDDEILIILTPRVVRMPNITAEDLQSIASGTDANPQVRTVDEATPQPTPPATTQAPAQPAAQPSVAYQTPPAIVLPQSMIPGGQPSMMPTSPNAPPGLRFEPANITLKPGETATVGIVVENVKDLSMIPLLLQYNPAVISVSDELRHGGFLGGDSQDAIVSRVDQQHGQATISVMRTPNTPGVNGTGTIVAFEIKAIAPGDSKLSIVQVSAKDSQQRPIQLVTAESTIHVHP
jgi:general secretion pathway protein D